MSRLLVLAALLLSTPVHSRPPTSNGSHDHHSPEKDDYWSPLRLDPYRDHRYGDPQVKHLDLHRDAEATARDQREDDNDDSEEGPD